MDEGRYWKVFLKQDNIYKGFLWKGDYDFNNYDFIKEITFNDVEAQPNTETLICQFNDSLIGDFSKVSIVQLVVENEFSDKDSSKIVLSIDNSDKSGNNYYHNPWLMHFAESKPNELQTGLYNYKFNPINNGKKQTITFLVQVKGKKNALKNIRVKFFAVKN